MAILSVGTGKDSLGLTTTFSASPELVEVTSTAVLSAVLPFVVLLIASASLQ